jgi:hypothetical protein
MSTPDFRDYATDFNAVRTGHHNVKNHNIWIVRAAQLQSFHPPPCPPPRPDNQKVRATRRGRVHEIGIVINNPLFDAGRIVAISSVWVPALSCSGKRFATLRQREYLNTARLKKWPSSAKREPDFEKEISPQFLRPAKGGLRRPTPPAR